MQPEEGLSAGQADSSGQPGIEKKAGEPEAVESVSSAVQTYSADSKDSPAQVASSGVQQLLKKVDAVVVKTMLDPDAMRRVFSRLSADKEIQLKELVQTQAYLPPKPCKIVERYQRATACDSNWERMSGGDRVRYCEGCQLQVYDFSDMDQGEAEELVFKREAKKDAVLYRRTDGRFITADCPVGIRRVQTMRVAIVGALVVIGAAIAYYLQLPPPQAVAPAARPKGAESLPQENSAARNSARAGDGEATSGQTAVTGDNSESSDPVERYRQQRLKLQQAAEQQYQQQSDQSQSELEGQYQQAEPAQTQQEMPLSTQQATPAPAPQVMPLPAEQVMPSQQATPAQNQQVIPPQPLQGAPVQTQEQPSTQSSTSPYVQQFFPRASGSKVP